jgi:hypothetical protein
MPVANVPFHAVTVPRRRTVPAGSLLWRVTREPEGATTAPTSTPLFWPGSRALGRAVPRRAGRFDPCGEHEYGYCYLALDDLTALAETLLRDIVFDGRRRSLPVAEAFRRRLVLLEATRELSLISLVSLEDLAAARQDTWLVHADESEYALTRCWGHWLRECASDADGIVWRSRRNPDGMAVLLFDDRCANGITFSELGFRRLDTPEGLDWLNGRLSLVQTYIAPEDVDGRVASWLGSRLPSGRG